MVGEDPARFDYLFESAHGDIETAGHAGPKHARCSPSAVARKTQLPWLAIVGATIVGMGIGLTIVVARPVEAGSTAPAVRPPTPASDVVPVSAVMPPPLLAPEPPPAPEATAEQAPQPVSTAAASTRPPRPRPTTPAVRPPMSVHPQPRPAFPNQQVPDGDGPRGGLLGGGGLL